MLTRVDLVALRDKYQTLERLCREPKADADGAYDERRRADKRLIAARFPGALRELEALEPEQLAARGRDIEACLALLAPGQRLVATACAPEEVQLPAALRWVAWIHDYHQAWRERLAAGKTVPTSVLPTSVPGTAWRRSTVANVVCRLAEQHGVLPEELRAELFGVQSVKRTD